jgi:deoxyribose-phosphate aldolase
MNIESYIELTALKPDTIIGDIEAACNEAVENNISKICVPPLYVRKAKELTADTAIEICAVIGFPFGYNPIESKVAEIVLAVIDAADEIEIVSNTSAVKNEDWQYVANEINTVMPIIRSKGKKISIVLETALLTEKQITAACDIYGVAGIDFMKAGTGMIENGSVAENLQLIRKHIAAAIRLKAPTVGSFTAAQQLIRAGADRICCTNALKLIQESIQQN